MEVLEHVWALDEATVADVRERILEEREVAYTTVMTVLKNLADKGYLKYRKDGRSYVYSAARPAERVRGSLLSNLVEKVFGGSPTALVQTLVQQEELDEDEMREIERLIHSMEKEDE